VIAGSRPADAEAVESLVRDGLLVLDGDRVALPD